MKKTRVEATATFAEVPMPSATMSSGARAMRGMAFAASR